MKANHKNVTISVPEPLLHQFRIYAATRKQSMTDLIAGFMRNAVAQEGENAHARRRILERLENPPDLGTNGKITWRREDLYEDRLRRY